MSPKRRDVMRLTFRKGEPCSVQRREPADDCRQHRYYTAFGRICKYSIVTKIDEFFCEKTYELENAGDLDAVFWCFFHRHSCRRCDLEYFLRNCGIFFKKLCKVVF